MLPLIERPPCQCIRGLRRGQDRRHVRSYACAGGEGDLKVEKRTCYPLLLLFKGDHPECKTFVGLKGGSTHHPCSICGMLHADLHRLPDDIVAVYFVCSAFHSNLATKCLEQPYLSISDPDSVDGNGCALELCRCDLETQIGRATAADSALIMCKLYRAHAGARQWAVCSVAQLSRGDATAPGYELIRATIAHGGAAWK